jgi:PAS domain-containing protein
MSQKQRAIPTARSRPPIPVQETDPLPAILGDPARLEAVRVSDLLDSGSEAAFDRVADLALAMFGVPMAAVSVIDAGREWFKARRGLDVTEVPAMSSFGARTLLGEGELIVPDAVRDRRFRSHPLVVGAPSIRFCAAVVVRSREGFAVGAVSVFDSRPWAALPADRMAGLHALARLAEAELESRRLADRLAATTDRLRDLSGIASDWVWATDAEHRMVNLSSELPHMASQAALVAGKRRWDFPESFPVAGSWEDHKAVLDSHREFRDFEYRLVTYVGDRSVFRISGRPVFDRSGGFQGYRGIASNVTRQREQERTLAASEALYRNLVDSVVDLVFTTDTSGRFTYASAAAMA